LKIWFCLQGFSEEVMSVLRKTSRTTSQDQLKTVLHEALPRSHIKRADTKEAAATALADLENPDSELRKTMANLKPLHYV
jgi:phage-related minor tail protein